MSHQCIADAFAEVEARFKEEVMEDTWGHLAPLKNRVYRGRVVYAVGCFGTPNPNIIVSEFKTCDGKELDGSPWFYNSIHDFINTLPHEAGCVYEFKGTFRNYQYNGTVKLIKDFNQE